MSPQHGAHSANVAHLNDVSRPVQVVRCTPSRCFHGRILGGPRCLACLAIGARLYELRGGDEWDRALRRRPVAVTFVEVRP